MSYVLGFDTSLTCTGWAVLEYEDGALVDSGTIEPPLGGSLYERLKFLACSTEDVLVSLGTMDFNVALEGGFSARSGSITRVLAMAWIMVALTAYDFTGYEPLEYPPTNVKKLATGKGNASKEEVLEAAFERWGVEDSSDIADACWVAESLRLTLKGLMNDGE